jgi:hypothetical protein
LREDELQSADHFCATMVELSTSHSSVPSPEVPCMPRQDSLLVSPLATATA